MIKCILLGQSINKVTNSIASERSGPGQIKEVRKGDRRKEDSFTITTSIHFSFSDNYFGHGGDLGETLFDHGRQFFYAL